MPLFDEASVIRRQARARIGSTERVDVPALGPSPNGNLLALNSNALRVDAVIRNCLGLPGFPAGAAVLFYDYFDNVNMLTEGFPLEAGASIAVQPNQAIYMRSSAGVIPVAIDVGAE